MAGNNDSGKPRVTPGASLRNRDKQVMGAVDTAVRGTRTKAISKKLTRVESRIKKAVAKNKRLGR